MTDWLDHFTDEQRHAHSLQSIRLRNGRIRRVSSSMFGPLHEPCMCGAEDCPKCFPLTDDEIERNRRDREDMQADAWIDAKEYP